MTIAFLLYLVIPSPDFPQPLSDSLQSDEPADTETPLRRGYFTDMTRDEVMTHYYNQFSKSKNGVPLVTYKLNYPPEDSQTLIRDQTRSTFLEEIVHPFRESIFVNGFEPSEDKDLIRVGGKQWRQKVIVRYYPSNIISRLAIGIMTGIVGLLVIEFSFSKLFNLIKVIKK